MKKTTLVLLGALMASVMPGHGLRAQNVTVNVDVRTLDRAALTSATIYAGNAGQLYIADSAHLMLPWSGTALQASDNVLASAPMTITTDGGNITASATVDSATYGYSFIIAYDANSRCYVLGTSSRQTLDTGYFAPASLMSQAVDGQLNRTMTAGGTMLGTERALVMDGGMFTYTTFANAIDLCPDSAVLSFMDTIRVNAPITITSPLTIYQMGYPMVSSYADPSTALVSVNGTELSWFGNATDSDIVMPASSGNLFDVNAATLTLRQFGAKSYAQPVVAHDGANVTIAGSYLNSLTDAPAVSLLDSSNASISSLNVPSAVFAQFGSDATGTLTLLDSTAAATSATIGADAYFRSGNYRKYLRTLGLAAAAANDTVFLARNTAAGTNDTLTTGAIIDLQGNAILGSLYVDDTEVPVYLLNGMVNYLGGVAGATTTVFINGLDSVATLSPSSLNVVVNDARILVVNPLTGANVTVLGGKYAQDVTSYLPARYAIVPNMDADSVPFRYKVGEGYRVTFVNYNARQGQAGYADSVAIVNTYDNRIVPAPSRPTYVGSDTIFSAYFINPEFTTPWNFLNDVLTSDTVLYAKWYQYNSATDGRYTVYHYRQALDGTYPETMVDSAFGIAPLGQDLITNANTYVGFTTDKAADTVVNFSHDTTINFHYVRNHYTMTFILNGGMHTPYVGDTMTAIVLYGDSVAYPDVTRPGHTLIGWTPVYTLVPAFNATTEAVYVQNTYPVAWSHVDTTVTYNGTSYLSEITASYVDDNGNPVAAVLTVTDADGNVVTECRNAGVYTFTATSADTNYLLGGVLVNTLTITPAPVVATGISVVTAKIYDGTATATVNNMGTPSPVFGNDDLSLNTTATYDNPAVGENKTITAQLTLMGADAANYMLASASQVITTAGVIVAPVVFDNTQASNGIAISAAGYCSGDNSAVQFYLTSGSPDQYKIVYDAAAQAEGFVDVNWASITTAGNIDLTIPVDAAYGTYNATVTLRNSAYPQFESAAIPISFLVNLSRNYTMAIFSDVIGVVDTCNCIDLTSVKWYHNGTYVGDGPYYQEVGGLTGSYHVTMDMNGSSVQTCEQTDLVTTAPEASSVDAVVTTYPNPAVDQVTVTIENSYSATHSLRVMNVMGVTLVSTTFEGKSAVVDFTRFGAGSYTVSVDGIVARVIKY